MEGHVYFEVVANGKMDDYKAWFEARNKRHPESMSSCHAILVFNDFAKPSSPGNKED